MLGFHFSFHSLLTVSAGKALARQTAKPFGKVSWTAPWKALRWNNLRASEGAAVRLIRANASGRGLWGQKGERREGKEVEGTRAQGPRT